MEYLSDISFSELSKHFLSQLTWLDNSFGRAWRIAKTQREKDYYFPAVYRDDNNYIDVSPDQKLGNFSFFQINDPNRYENYGDAFGKLTYNVSIIFWFDLRKIPGAERRNTEMVKDQILKTIYSTPFTSSNINITNIYETARNIYREYNIEEIDNQFLMQPFAGFRFEGELIIQQIC